MDLGEKGGRNRLDSGYPLDCDDYWSTCGAETISLQFHVSICLPRIGLFPRHIRHTHRHHLHPLLELLRDYVRINHHHHHHPYHHHHHHHTHRHRLHPLLELLRLLKLAFFIFKPIVFIFTIYYFTGTSELPSPCHLLVNNFIRPRYPGTRYLLVSNLFRPRYRRATKKSTVLDHWGKKVHFLVNLIFWSMNSKHVKEHKL